MIDWSFEKLVKLGNAVEYYCRDRAAAAANKSSGSSNFFSIVRDQKLQRAV